MRKIDEDTDSTHLDPGQLVDFLALTDDERANLGGVASLSKDGSELNIQFADGVEDGFKFKILGTLSWCQKHLQAAAAQSAAMKGKVIWVAKDGEFFEAAIVNDSSSGVKMFRENLKDQPFDISLDELQTYSSAECSLTKEICNTIMRQGGVYIVNAPTAYATQDSYGEVTAITFRVIVVGIMRGELIVRILSIAGEDDDVTGPAESILCDDFVRDAFTGEPVGKLRISQEDKITPLIQACRKED